MSIFRNPYYDPLEQFFYQTFDDTLRDITGQLTTRPCSGRQLLTDSRKSSSTVGKVIYSLLASDWIFLKLQIF